MIQQVDAALLVELTVTSSRKQFVRVLDCLRERGWDIVSTPRHDELGLSNDGTADVSHAEDQGRRGVSAAEDRTDPSEAVAQRSVASSPGCDQGIPDA